VFTATEGAIAACVWSLFLGVVWYRTMKLKQLVKVSMDTVETTGTQWQHHQPTRPSTSFHSAVGE
jgi:TRAP-type C4-dicarboxylate transport system permease large subunit